MTMDYLEFDGDSHTRKANWFGMTVLFGGRTSLYKFQFVDLVFLFYHVIVSLSTVFPVGAGKVRNVPGVGGVRLLGKAIQVI